MSRLVILFFVILFLFSCSSQLMVQQIRTKNIPINSATSVNDSLVLSLIRPYRDSIEQDMSKVIAVSDAAIVKGKPDSKLTNLVADILLEYGRSYCVSTNAGIVPDASYINYGGLRGSLPAGKITVGNIFELMPFENEVVILQLSGGALTKMAEKIASRGGEGVAGLKIGITGNSLSDLKIGSKNVDPKATYWLVTNDYTANGGDQMSMFLDPVGRIDTKMKIRDLLIRALTKRYQKDGIISIKEDGRIYNE